MKRIIILWATIRPEMMIDTWRDWYKNSVLKFNIHLIVATATQEQKQIIDDAKIHNCEVKVYNEKKGYNSAITYLTSNLEVNDQDILLLLSDDFFAFPHWDLYIYKKFENYDGALFLNDGYQDPNAKTGQLCITLACMTFNCLKKLNKIVFHPDYKHFFSDNEAYINLTELGLLKDDRDIDKAIFEHRHHVLGKRKADEHDSENFSHWDEDKRTFDCRRLMLIEDRLKISEVE